MPYLYFPAIHQNAISVRTKRERGDLGRKEEEARQRGCIVDWEGRGGREGEEGRGQERLLSVKTRSGEGGREDNGQT